MSYVGRRDFDHAQPERIGVLLVNSGTPDSPSTRDVRRFLGRLLGDPRVIELPRALWLPLLHGVILRTRPFRSARKYRQIWTPEGSPLLLHSERLRDAVRRRLGGLVRAPVAVEIGMLYASPGVADGLARLRDAGAQRILVLPLFPQYSGVSTGAVYDQVQAELRRWRWVPELRFVGDYADYPPYVDALRDSVAAHWAAHGRTAHLLMSFHGIPERYFREGDPYFCKCQRTARLLADELDLAPDEWSVAFQSRYGPGRWLQPYTDAVIASLPQRGVGSLTVVCPGFAADCLETLEEIAIENRERFLAAGGERFEYVPALNSGPLHAQAIASLAARHAGGWTRTGLDWLGAATSTATAPH